MMNSVRYCCSLLLLLFLASLANAALVDNGDGTITQTRNGMPDLMWLKDTNYAATSGYHATGQMTFAEADAWIDHLNATELYGYDNWRLPTNLPVNGTVYDYNFSYDGTTDRGYNITDIDCELAYLHYVELNNVPLYDTEGNLNDGHHIVEDPGPFINVGVADEAYYSGTEYSPDPINARWAFSFGQGNQFPKQNPAMAWAVREVPEPASLSMLALGSITLLRRRRSVRRC